MTRRREVQAILLVLFGCAGPVQISPESQARAGTLEMLPDQNQGSVRVYYSVLPLELDDDLDIMLDISGEVAGSAVQVRFTHPTTDVRLDDDNTARWSAGRTNPPNMELVVSIDPFDNIELQCGEHVPITIHTRWHVDPENEVEVTPADGVISTDYDALVTCT